VARLATHDQPCSVGEAGKVNGLGELHDRGAGGVKWSV